PQQQLCPLPCAVIVGAVSFSSPSVFAAALDGLPDNIVVYRIPSGCARPQKIRKRAGCSGFAVWPSLLLWLLLLCLAFPPVTAAPTITIPAVRSMAGRSGVMA